MCDQNNSSSGCCCEFWRLDDRILAARKRRCVYENCARFVVLCKPVLLRAGPVVTCETEYYLEIEFCLRAVRRSADEGLRSGVRLIVFGTTVATCGFTCLRPPFAVCVSLLRKASFGPGGRSTAHPRVTGSDKDAQETFRRLAVVIRRMIVFSHAFIGEHPSHPECTNQAPKHGLSECEVVIVGLQ